jgi:hypothetical protein
MPPRHHARPRSRMSSLIPPATPSGWRHHKSIHHERGFAVDGEGRRPARRGAGSCRVRRQNRLAALLSMEPSGVRPLRDAGDGAVPLGVGLTSKETIVLSSLQFVATVTVRWADHRIRRKEALRRRDVSVGWATVACCRLRKFIPEAVTLTVDGVSTRLSRRTP